MRKERLSKQGLEREQIQISQTYTKELNNKEPVGGVGGGKPQKSDGVEGGEG